MALTAGPSSPMRFRLASFLLLATVCVSSAARIPPQLSKSSLSRPLFLKLEQRSFNLSYADKEDIVKRIGFRRGLAEARMWLYGHVLTEGYYYTTLGLGTPPQEFALIVDTGSTVTYVPCGTCTHCGNQHQDTPYVAADSSSFQAVMCQTQECRTGQCGADGVCSYSRHYAEDSTSSGVISSDLASFGGDSRIPPARILFGCETSETGDLYTQRADGIIGMGRGPLGIMDQLVGQGAVEDQFSLCYGGMARGGGSMIVGAVPPPPGMLFTPLQGEEGENPYYNVMLENILVQGQSLNLKPSTFLGGYGSVLDSGTTFTYLPDAAFQAVKSSVMKAATDKGLKQVTGPDPSYPGDICFAPAGRDLSKLGDFFPNISFVFSGPVEYHLAPENFLFRHTKNLEAYCLGIFKNQDGGTLLGGILMRNTMVTYDRAARTVGLWKTNCSSLFETLTALEGPQAPPLPQDLQAEPPSDIPNAYVGEEKQGGSGGGQSEGGSRPSTPPASPPPGSSCDGCAALLMVSVQVSVPADELPSLKDAFVSDMARELSLETTQLVDVSFAAASQTGASANSGPSDVHFIVIPSYPDTDLSPATVERIQVLLKKGDFSLRDAFGLVSLQTFTIVPPSSPSSTPSGSFYWYYVVGPLLGLAAVAAVIAGVVVWRRRAEAAKFSSLEEERKEEKAALADSEGMMASHEEAHEEPHEDTHVPVL